MAREAEVYSRLPEAAIVGSSWSSASGHALGGRLILTAAHGVMRGGTVAAELLVRLDSPTLFKAEVVWFRLNESVDVALLLVNDPAWVAPTGVRGVRWGQFVTRNASQACEVIGYPEVVARPRQRDTHHASGFINPASLSKSGMYAMEVPQAPATKNDGSPWAGMSGAAILRHGAIVAIVVEDAAGFDAHRLIAVPVSAFVDDPEFARVVERETKREIVIESVELLPIAVTSPRLTSPAVLLRADIAPTPFRPRSELDTLRKWCSGEVIWSSRLLVGPGGQGKTRVARQLARSLQRHHWATLILSDLAARDELQVLAQVDRPLLVIVDYADGRIPQLAVLAEALAAADRPVRLLLLARTAGTWRTQQLSGTDPPSAHLDFLPSTPVINLGQLEGTPRGRQEAWQEAAFSFAAALRHVDGYDEPAWNDIAITMQPPSLAGERYRTILGIQWDALASLLQLAKQLEVPDDNPATVLLAHEERYWKRTQIGRFVNLTNRSLGEAVATASLWGASNESEAVLTLRSIPSLREVVEDDLIGIATWLQMLYAEDGRYWSRLQPDRLAGKHSRAGCGRA